MANLSSWNLASDFLSRAAEAPERPALRLQGLSVSYGDLARRAGRIAATLSAAIEAPEARVGVLAKRSVDAYAGVLGTCMAGFTYVPIDPELPLDRQILLLQRARLSALITDTPPDPRLAHGALAPVFGPAELADTGVKPLLEARPMSPDAAAYMMFTSGTTGVPKAVIVTVDNVDHFLRVARERCPIFPDDRVSQFYELTFDLSVFDVFHGLGSGACLHVVPGPQRMAPAAFIAHERLTVWSSVPSVIGFLRQLHLIRKASFPSLRYSMFCGEPLLEAHVDAWREAAPGCVIDNFYGPTEATVACLAELVGDRPRTTPARATISIGRPFAGMRAAIVDAAGAFVSPGELGELALSGSQVAAGYFDDPDLTARRFRELDHPAFGRSIYYLTGDLAYEDAEGYFHHLGRIDNQVKILGRRVELEEIEHYIRALTGGEVVVVAWPLRGGLPIGVVAFISGGDWTEEALYDALEKKLPAHMIPRQLIRKSSLPVGATGKLSRAALLHELEQACDVAAQ